MYFQIDRRLGMLIDLQIASEIPLVKLGLLTYALGEFHDNGMPIRPSPLRTRAPHSFCGSAIRDQEL
jgi:hypothetical protein